MQKRARILTAAAGALTLATAAVALATIPDAAGVVHACYTNAGGALRAIDTNAGERCRSSETALTWSQRGLAGPVGPAGPAGSSVAYGYVHADGTLQNSSGNMTVVRLGGGTYCIGVTGSPVHVAVASLDSLQNVGGTVQAGVFFGSGCPAQASNIVVITREQAQNGGLPGTDKAFYIIVS